MCWQLYFQVADFRMQSLWQTWLSNAMCKLEGPHSMLIYNNILNSGFQSNQFQKV